MGNIGSLSLGFLLLGLAVHDLPVLGPCDRIPELVTEYRVDLVLVPVHTLTPAELARIIDRCLETDARVCILPNTFTLLRAGLPVNPLCACAGGRRDSMV